MAAIRGKEEQPARSLAFISASLLMTLLCVLPGAWTAAQQPGATSAATRISAGDQVERALPPGDVHAYLLELGPGTHLLALDQRGLDYQIHRDESDSRIHDSPTFRDDRETLLLEPAIATTYRLSIQSNEYTGAPGEYALTVETLDDQSSIEAYRFMTFAVAAMHGGSDSVAKAALELYRRALAIWQKTGNVAEQARTQLSIAQLQYWNTGPWDWQDAADSAADAALLYESLGLETLHANALSLQAAALIESAYEADQSSESDSLSAARTIYEEALALFETAAALQEENEQWFERAQTLNNIGLTWHNRDRWTEAVPYYEEAAAEFRRLEEWAAEMNPLANLAVIDQDSGRLVRAAATQERLLEIMPPDREPAWRADTLDNYASAKLILGDTDTALARFFEALEIHESIQDLKGQGMSLTGIGSAYRVIGEIDLAEDYFSRALPVREAANDGAGQMTVLRSLAEIDIERDDFDAALAKLDRASRIANSESAILEIGLHKAEAWIGNGQYARAAQILDESRRLAEALESTRDLADAAFWLGKLAAAQGVTDRAGRELREAARIYESIDVRSGLASSLLELAKLEHASGNYAEAVGFAALAIETMEGLRTEVTNPELRAVYLGTRVEYHDLLIDSLMRSIDGVAQSAHETQLYRALEASERAKARATVDLINEASVDLSATIDPVIAGKLNGLYASLAEVQFQRNQLLESGEEGTPRFDAILSRLLRVRAEIDVLETEARNSHPQYAVVQNPEVLRAAEIQGALGPDELLLQYWLGDLGSYLWIVGPRSIRSVSLPQRTRVDDIARRLHASYASGPAIGSAAVERQELLDELAVGVLHPAAEEIARASRIIIAGDGALQYLPFSVMRLPNGRPLIESHELLSVPSMTVIAAQREMLADRIEPEFQVALVGDPVFQANDPRLRDAPSTSAVSSQTRSPPDRSFARLPFTGREIDVIAAMVPESERLVATGLDARTNRVAGSGLRDYQYVHLATHGVIDSEHPVLSSLVFSTFGPDGRPVDGFFRLRDVYTMRLRADAVVLSACETALGREVRGEGLIGLTQGFLHAGAKSVIASLWQVPDRATSELMTLLYRNLLGEEQAPAEALRNAQLELSANRRWQDPYFWSGFVLMGDWT